MNRVRQCLSVAGALLALALILSTPLPAADATLRKRVVFLGDSITAGYGLDPAEAYPALIQQKIDAAALPFTVVNAGVSGDTTTGGLRRIDWVLRQPVDVLVVALGGNDGLRGIPADLTRTNLLGILARARARNPATVCLLAGMQMPPNLGPEYTTAFRALFPAVAKEASASLIPFLLEGVGGDPAMNQPDQIHPTAEGHRRIADTVWATLRPVLESSAGSKPPASTSSK